MLLKKCFISNFGKLQDFTYDFTEGLNVICEENGWGKSTFAAFIRAMLYGMPQSGNRTKLEDAERRKYKPWKGGELGGYLVFEANGKEYKVERTFGAKEAEDTFRLVDLSTNLESSDFSTELGKELFGLDKEAYSRSTYLPQNKISNGGMNDSIGKKLGRIAEGDEESGSFDVAYAKLDDLRKKYIPDRQKDEKGYVAEITRRISDTEMRMESCRRKEENAKPWREKEQEAAEKKKEYAKELKVCREKLEAAAGYEAILAKKRHYGELCRQEEKLKQQKEGLESLLPAGIPDDEELKQCRKEAEEAAALAGELRSYRMTEEEHGMWERLQNTFRGDVPENESIQECIRTEKETEEKRAAAEDFYKKAEETEREERKNGKNFLVCGILVLLLAVVFLAGAVLPRKASQKKDSVPSGIVTEAEQTVQTVQPTDSVKSGSVGSIILIICAGLTAAGSVGLVALGLAKKKKERMAREEKEKLASELALYRDRGKQGRELLSRFGMGEETDVTEALYRLAEQVREYRRLSEQDEKYRHCSEKRKKLLSKSEEVLRRYRMETEDVTGSLYLLEQRRRDFLRFFEDYAEAVKKREQFERENPSEEFFSPVQPEESYAQLQEKEHDIMKQIALLDEVEKDCRDRAEAFEEEAEDYAELAETLVELQEELATKKREHALVTETMKCLKSAKEQFSSRYMRGLQKGFGEYVELLGGTDLERSMEGRFGGVETDINLQVQVSAYGKGKELGYFSTGVRDLIALCMRFALVDALFEEEEPFLILDDPFVNFDEEKLGRALEFLKKTSKKYQILYLVCHSSRV